MMNDFAPIRQALRTPAFDEALADYLGVNPTDLRCLELVIADPGLTPGRLAELAGLTSGAVTGVVDRLERAGYVVRRPDPADRRSVTLAPVPARAAEVAAAVAPLAAEIEALLQAGSASEREAIERFLDAAARAVDAETARLRAETRGGFVGNVFRAPVGNATRGRLVFASGAPRLSLNIAPLGPRASARIIAETSASRLEFTGAAPAGELVVATFDGPRPDVRATGGVVSIRYRRQAIAAFTTRTRAHRAGRRDPVDARARRRDHGPHGHVWRASRSSGWTWTAERTTSCSTLPHPTGTGAVRLKRRGKQRDVPAARGRARRRAGRGRRLAAARRRPAPEMVGGLRRYVGPGYAESPDRYELEVLGGASEVIVN